MSFEQRGVIGPVNTVIVDLFSDDDEARVEPDPNGNVRARLHELLPSEACTRSSEKNR